MKTPVHLWLVGIVALLWNVGGAFDYLMTQLEVESYMALLTEAQRTYMAGRPVWFDAAWAFGVWGAVLGSVLLLARSRWATAAFGVALAGLAVSGLWSYALSTPRATEVMGNGIVMFTLLVAATLVGLMLYSRAMTERGVLR